MIPASVLATGLWLLLYVDGPLFNLFAPLTGEFRTYTATCQGWVFRVENPFGSGIPAFRVPASGTIKSCIR